MQTFDIEYARMHLSELVEAASRGQAFLISKSGVPLVMVAAISEPPAKAQRRIGFLSELLTVPDDFDRLGQDEVEQLFDPICSGPAEPA
jgi:antitoxin (DNA-binding transcriptional repressor) of toxin-antitoxin stability system